MSFGVSQTPVKRGLKHVVLPDAPLDTAVFSISSPGVDNATDSWDWDPPHHMLFENTSNPDQPDKLAGLSFRDQVNLLKKVEATLSSNSISDPEEQHYGPCKNSWKKSKIPHLDCSSHIEGDIMQNHEQEKKVKKVKKWTLL
jgi:hypothetical protein